MMSVTSLRKNLILAGICLILVVAGAFVLFWTCLRWRDLQYSTPPGKFREFIDKIDPGLPSAEVEALLPGFDKTYRVGMSEGHRQYFVLLPRRRTLFGLPLLEYAIVVYCDSDAKVTRVEWADL